MNFAARLEPEDGIIHGAGQDLESYLRYSALSAADKRPLMYMTYITLTAGPKAVIDWQQQLSALNRLAGQPTILQIGLNLTAGRDDGSGRADEVAHGRYDLALGAFLAGLKAFGVPAFVRIGYEFEGSWNN